MPRRGRGPQLPKAMKDQLNESGASQSLRNTGGGSGRGGRPAGNNKKSKSLPAAAMKSKSAPAPKSQSKPVSQPQQKQKKRKLEQDLEPEPAPTSKKPKQHQTALEKLMAAQHTSKPQAGSTSAMRKPSSAAEAQEDLEIAWLEAQLRGGKGQSEDGEGDDGLGELLGELEHVEEALGWRGGAAKSSGKRAAEESESSSQESDEEHEDDEEDESDDDDEGLDEDEWDGIEQDDDEELELDKPSEETDNRSPTPQAQPAPAEPAQTAAPTSTSTYVPPHLRTKATPTPAPAASTSTSTELTAVPTDPRLDRLISSHLNKLSPSNLGQIHQALSGLSNEWPRATVSSSIVRLVLLRVDTRDSLGETQVLCFAALVGGLKGVREEVLLESLKRYDAKQKTQDDEEEGKSAANLVRFWARLYNLGVVSCAFIYGLVRELVARLQEDDVEQLLLLLKVSGQQLRSDDPTSLKEIAQLVSDRAASEDLSSRTKFMVETLTALKHNRPQKIAGDTSLATTEDQFKKHLKKLSLDTLNMSLSELREAESRGKWWIVGHAWGGDPLVERQAQAAAASATEKRSGTDEDKWIKLARKQGMNTSVRQGVFVALMGAEDYVDAVDRLAGLSLSEVQQREIVRVILHCASYEKAYNPYYTLVLQRLLSSNHSHAITTQYALWDLFKELGESSVGGHERLKNVQEESEGKGLGKRRQRNLERLFGWVLAKGGLSLGVFKVLPWSTLKPPSKSFLKGILGHLFISSQSSSPLQLNATVNNPSALEEVFIKVVNTSTAQGLAGVIEEIVDESDQEEVVKRMGEVALEVLEMGEGIVHDVDRLR